MRPDLPTPRNVRSAGALVTANFHDGVGIFTGYDLRPGDIRSGTVMIANVGSVAGSFRLSEAAASNTFAPGELTLRIDDVTSGDPATVFVGDIGSLPSNGIDLGCFEPRQSHRFRFLTMLDLNSHSAGRGLGAGAAYEWDFAPGEPAAEVSIATYRAGR